MVTQDLSVEQARTLVRTMFNIGAFRHVHLSRHRNVQGGCGYSYTKKGEAYEVTRSLYCFSDSARYQAWNKRERRMGTFVSPPIWRLEFTYLTDKRYIYEETIEGTADCDFTNERVETKINNAWFKDSPCEVNFYSDETKSQFEQDIRELLSRYNAIQDSHRSVATWHERGLEVWISCSCGHHVRRDARDFAKQHGDVPDIFAMASAMRCSACNVRGEAKVVPVYRKGFFPSKDKWRRGEGRASPPEYGPNDIYDAMGGDGTQDVYLTDNVFLEPPVSEEGH